MTVEKKNKPHADVVDYLKELSFYDKQLKNQRLNA